jgi:uncharacterized protein DUF4232
MTLDIPGFALDPLIAEAKRRARARRLLLIAMALVAGGVAAGTLALGGSDQGRPAIAAPDACRITQLDVVPGRLGVAAGTAMRDFALVNASEASCTLRGWPNLRLLLGNGRIVTPRVHRDHYDTGKVLPVRAIDLRPGAAASFRVAESDGTGTGLETCRAVTALLISLSGAGGRVSASNGVFYCAPYVLFEVPLVAGRVNNRVGY